MPVRTLMRLALPSKSSAHWLRLQVASVARRCDMVLVLVVLVVCRARRAEAARDVPRCVCCRRSWCRRSMC